MADVTPEPDPWRTNAAGPFLTVGEVSVLALGENRFRVTSPDGEREIEGFEQARGLAHELARLKRAGSS